VGLNASNLILANLSRSAESVTVRKFYMHSRVPLILLKYEDLLNIISRTPNESIKRLIPIQQLSWALEAGEGENVYY